MSAKGVPHCERKSITNISHTKIIIQISIQTICQRKTQIRQKLGLQEGEDIVEMVEKVPREAF